MQVNSRKEVSDILSKTAKERGATIYRIVTDSPTPIKHNQGRAVLEGSKNYTIDTLFSICHSLGLNIHIDNKEQPPVQITDLSSPSKTKGKPITDPKPTTSVTVDTMPQKKKGESAIDFAVRKNEWKKKQLKS